MLHGSENESHHHDIVNYLHPKIQIRSRKAWNKTRAPGSTSKYVTITASEKPHAIAILKIDCNPTQFHIAKMKALSTTCHVLQARKKKRCRAVICKNTKKGTPAPTYNGRKIEWHTTKIIQLDFQFYIDDILRCVAGTKYKWIYDWPLLPNIQLVARNTNLTKAKIIFLKDAGFQLQIKSRDILPQCLFHTSSGASSLAGESSTPIDCGSHPIKRLRRTMRQNANAPFTDQKNSQMIAQNVKAIMKSVTFIPYLGHGRIITLESSIFSNQSTNMIMIYDFPTCTCDHFVNMYAAALSSRKAWLNYKHFYYVYLYICKTNAEDDKFMHAFTFNFEEVQDFLRGTNLQIWSRFCMLYIQHLLFNYIYYKSSLIHT